MYYLIFWIGMKSLEYVNRTTTCFLVERDKIRSGGQWFPHFVNDFHQLTFNLNGGWQIFNKSPTFNHSFEQRIAWQRYRTIDSCQIFQIEFTPQKQTTTYQSSASMISWWSKPSDEWKMKYLLIMISFSMSV